MRLTNQRVIQIHINKLIFRGLYDIGAWSNIIFHLKITFCLIVLGIKDNKIPMNRVISSYNNEIWLQVLNYFFYNISVMLSNSRSIIFCNVTYKLVEHSGKNLSSMAKI